MTADPAPPDGAPDRWFHRHRTCTDARLRLLTIPYAGAGPAVFHRWVEVLPPAVELWTVQLPGRAARIFELPLTGIDVVVEELKGALARFDDVVFALFGHSMGALLGFELARAQRRAGQAQPAHIFVSGHPAPQLPPDTGQVHTLSDPDFLERIRELGGTPEEALENPDLMELFLPVLRADFTAVETYAYVDEPPLGVGITAFGGRDDSLVTPAQLEAWRAQTLGPFHVRLLPGDHFYLNHSAPMIVESIKRRFECLLSA